MKRVLISHAGGRIGMSFARALKAAPEPIHTIGIDSDEYHLQRAATDEKYLIPRAGQEDFLAVLLDVIDGTRPDLVWLQHEAEIRLVAEHGHRLPARAFLPPAATIELAQDKMGCYHRLKAAGIPVPMSLFIQSPQDLHRAFEVIGSSLWIRAIRGTAGQGSLPVDTYEMARKWIDLHTGWGRFMAAERMTKESGTWESVWRRGELIAAQGRRRMKWEFPHLTMSGVTGITGVSRYVADPAMDDVALRAVRALDAQPHGIFSVDMAWDERGTPRVTEINGGRFLSGGAIAGPVEVINLPYLAVLAAMEEPIPADLPLLNKMPTDYVILRGVDLEPRAVPITEVERYRVGLEARRLSLRQARAPRAVSEPGRAGVPSPVPAGPMAPGLAMT